MKKLIFIIILSLLVASCNVQRFTSGEGEVRFQFSTGADYRALFNIEDAYALVVSIEDAEGNEVYTSKELALYRIGSGYVSEPLALRVGTYRLTQFLVIDEERQVIFATPVEGSDRAYLVSDPLPIEFTVSADEITEVSPEVLDVEGAEPEEFGYPSFDIDVVETFNFLLSVFVTTETGHELTTADLTITGGAVKLYSGTLAAGTNKIEVRGGYPTYELKIEKAGYETYEETFIEAELRGYFESPLVVILEESGIKILNEQFKLLASDGGQIDNFGYALAFSGDRIVVGAYGHHTGGLDQAGAVYVYHRDGASWVEEAKLAASDYAAYDRFGSAVDISGDRVIVGAVWDDDNGADSGSAYIFHRNGASWNQEAKLTHPDITDGEFFGYSVAISGDYAIVGAIYDNALGTRSGSAFVYHWDGSNWNYETKLTPSDGVSFDFFGTSVSLDTDCAIIGAYGKYSNGYYGGAAYIFRLIGSTWVQEAKLTASDAYAYDYFGCSVSVSGDHVIVGAYENDDLGDASGSAYIFKYNGTNWNEVAKLTAYDGASGDSFGISVSIFGNHAVVGANYDDDTFSNSGSAHVYQLVGSVWVEKAKLLPSDGAKDDYFGISVSQNDEYIVVGSWFDDDRGVNSGSAYVFKK